MVSECGLDLFCNRFRWGAILSIMEHACHRRRILAFRHHSGVKQVAPLYPTSSSLESGGSMMSDYLSGNRREPFCGNAMQVIRFPKLNIHIWLVLWFSVSMLPPLRAESPMQGAPIETMLRIPASRFQNRSREQLSIDLRRGIGPDDAATIALTRIRRCGPFAIDADSPWRN